MDACPTCPQPHVVKAGQARGHQRWLCRGGGDQLTGTTPRGRPRWQNSLAVVLSCHGVAMTALGKRFGVWASTIRPWMRQSAEDHAEQPAPSGQAIGLARDAMGQVRKNTGAHAGAGRLWT